jgi:hypothetical protein
LSTSKHNYLTDGVLDHQQAESLRPWRQIPIIRMAKSNESIKKIMNPTFCTCYNLPRQEKSRFMPSKANPLTSKIAGGQKRSGKGGYPDNIRTAPIQPEPPA